MKGANKVKTTRRKALDMRNQGNTFKKIGAALGVGACRAREIYLSALREQNRPNHDFDVLSRRAANCLRDFGIEDRGSALAAVNSGALHHKNKDCRNYGRMCHKEVCAWLGILQMKKVEIKLEEGRRAANR